tara:strand:+ start:38078 stop:38326 length:249 start_codon:yes stop_codon:yes gene_type:complete
MSQFTKRKATRLAQERALDKAYKALEFDKNTKPSQDQVRERYHELVRAMHPDSAVKEGDSAPLNIDILRKAKDLILNNPYRR